MAGASSGSEDEEEEEPVAPEPSNNDDLLRWFALIAVGIFAVYGVSSGMGDIFADVPAEAIRGAGDIFGPRWAVLTFLSATAIICLPRQFQVTVVENVDERHLATASWLFPLYLFGMCLFVMPIAIAASSASTSRSHRS